MVVTAVERPRALRTPFLAGRTDLFVLAAAAISLVNGYSMTAVPRSYAAPIYDTLRPGLTGLGLAFAVGGVLLLVSRGLSPLASRLAMWASVVPFCILAGFLLAAGGSTGVALYGLTALGLVVASLQRPDADLDATWTSLFHPVLATILAVYGAAYLLTPLFGAPLGTPTISANRPELWGLGFLVAAGGVLAAGRAAAEPSTSAALSLAVAAALAGYVVVLSVDGAQTGVNTWTIIVGLLAAGPPAARLRLRPPASDGTEDGDTAVLERLVEAAVWAVVLVALLVAAADDQQSPALFVAAVATAAFTTGWFYVARSWPMSTDTRLRVACLAYPVLFFAIAQASQRETGLVLGIADLVPILLATWTERRRTLWETLAVIVALRVGAVVVELARDRGMSATEAFDTALPRVIALVLLLTAAALAERLSRRALRAERSLRRAVQREALASSLASQARRSLDAAEILGTTVAALGRAAGADVCEVRLAGDDGDALTGARHAWRRAVAAPDPFPAPDPSSGGGPGTGGADPGAFTRAAREGRRVDTATATAIPLSADDVLIGVLALGWTAPPAADDRDLAEAVADELSVAVAHSRLYQRAVAQADEMSRLRDLGERVLSPLDVAGVLTEATASVRAILHAGRCGVRLYDPARGTLRLIAADGWSDWVRAELAEVPLGEFPSGQAAAESLAVGIHDSWTETRFPGFALVARREGFRGYYSVPILGTDRRILGTLLAAWTEPYTPTHAEQESVEAFAGQVAIALEHSQLYDRVAIERDRFRVLIERLGEGIATLDADGRVTLWNRAAERITGWEARDVVGARFPGLEAGRALAAEQARTPTPAALGDDEGRHLAVARHDGTLATLRAVFEVVGRADGDGQEAIVSFRDVSAELEVERMKQDFVYTVSHELRTPMTSIYGFTATLLRTDVAFSEADRRAYLTIMREEVERLSRMIDDLLSVGRIDAGRVDLRPAPVRVDDVAGDVVALLALRDEGRHELALAAPGGPVDAVLDPDKLRQVLTNLVDNAIKYSPDGGAVTVTVEAAPDEAAVRIAVRDEGIGIGDADVERVFRRFFRADVQMRRGIGGTGLGLYITAGLVRAMGGRIDVASALGEGSTFTVVLPAGVSSAAGSRPRTGHPTP